MTTDNSAFAMAAYDENTGGVVADVYAYIPADRLEEKSKLERIDYKEFVSSGKCTACGDRVIDYSVIEKDILNIEEKFGCNVVGVGYDRYNAMSTAQKLEAEGLETIIVRQHSSVPVSYTHLDVYKRQVMLWLATKDGVLIGGADR